MNRPITRYTASRKYISLALFAVGGALLGGWTGMRWTSSWIVSGWIASGLFVLSALAVLVLAVRPAVEIHEGHLQIGQRKILWGEIRRLDQTGWNAPLAVYLTLDDERRFLLIYPGDLDSCGSLLRHLRRYSREALLDGHSLPPVLGESVSSG